MQNLLSVFNTYTRTKEKFEPLHAPFVGMYVCGPTVYGEAHLGHARPAITFDLIFRYLTHLGYKVRYVRNITDVGHLENDADEGEDKIAKKARAEQLEPMEIAQLYTDCFHRNIRLLNVLSPSIEPRATGHIIEQIKMIECIINNGYAYIVNGSVYFDVVKYSKEHNYGKLSGRVLDELISGIGSRELDNQEEKRNSADFALWKKASPEHIMRWPSPWSEGFPGWHIECSAMSKKYLGETFDIHGGGMDLLFPHHECEIAQSEACNHTQPAKYWIHNNMLTINGQKMGKSLGNFITLDQFFTGNHPLLEQAYSPMTVRFFFLQAHYRSTVDFSNEALKAAEKGLKKLMGAFLVLPKLKPSEVSTSDIKKLREECYSALNDDFNSAILIANLFEGVRIINSVNAGTESITREDLSLLNEIFTVFVTEILGLKEEDKKAENNETEELMKLILDIRSEMKSKREFAIADKIRDELAKINIKIKDQKDGTVWTKD